MIWENKIRGDSVYLSADMHRALRVIAKAASGGEKVTKDQVADALLRKIIEKEYPQLAKYQSDVEEIETEMIESIRKMPA